MIVTLQEARDHLQSTHSADDADLTLKIQAASEAVVTYLKLEDEGDIPAKATFASKAATLILVGEFYANREAEQGGAVDAQFGRVRHRQDVNGRSAYDDGRQRDPRARSAPRADADDRR